MSRVRRIIGAERAEKSALFRHPRPLTPRNVDGRTVPRYVVRVPDVGVAQAISPILPRVVRVRARRHRSWRGLLAFVGFLVLHATFGLGPAVTRVLADAAEGPAYRAAIDEALREYEAEHYEEARALFARAHELYPNARTLRGMAMVAFELRRYIECIERLTLALHSNVKPLTAPMRAEAEQLLARANGFVGRLQVDATPREARLLVDGVPEALRPDAPVLLEIGEHLLEVQAAGHVAERRKLNVVGGETQRWAVALKREPSVAHDTEPAPRKRWYKSPWLWTTLGLALAGGAVGTVFALRARDGSTAAPYQGNVGSYQGP